MSLNKSTVDLTNAQQEAIKLLASKGRTAKSQVNHQTFKSLVHLGLVKDSGALTKEGEEVAADGSSILERTETELTITISGQAGSGKSTTARLIAHHLESLGYKVQLKDDDQAVEVPTEDEVRDWLNHRADWCDNPLTVEVQTKETDPSLIFHYKFAKVSE